MRHDLWLPAGYEPIDRAAIESRQSGRDDMRKLGIVHIEGIGCPDVNLTAVPDPRDVRRFRFVNLDGVLLHHCAGPELLRRLASGNPKFLGRRHW